MISWHALDYVRNMYDTAINSQKFVYVIFWMRRVVPSAGLSCCRKGNFGPFFVQQVVLYENDSLLVRWVCPHDFGNFVVKFHWCLRQAILCILRHSLRFLDGWFHRIATRTWRRRNWRRCCAAFLEHPFLDPNKQPDIHGSMLSSHPPWTSTAGNPLFIIWTTRFVPEDLDAELSKMTSSSFHQLQFGVSLDWPDVPPSYAMFGETGLVFMA